MMFKRQFVASLGGSLWGVESPLGVYLSVLGHLDTIIVISLFVINTYVSEFIPYTISIHHALRMVGPTKIAAAVVQSVVVLVVHVIAFCAYYLTLHRESFFADLPVDVVALCVWAPSREPVPLRQVIEQGCIDDSFLSSGETDISARLIFDIENLGGHFGVPCVGSALPAQGRRHGLYAATSAVIVAVVVFGKGVRMILQLGTSFLRRHTSLRDRDLCSRAAQQSLYQEPRTA